MAIIKNTVDATMPEVLSKLDYEISKPNVLSPQAPTNNT
jgi:hypothetical protein